MTAPLLSIVVPAIRVPKWPKFYESIEKSCKNYAWELILVSPFDLPEELKSKTNIKLIKDYGHPTRCLQLGLFEAEGALFFHTTDDALCYEDAIDEAIDFFMKNCNYKDVVNMRYKEGANYSGVTMQEGYWNAWFHGPLQLSGIPIDYKISLHHMLKTDYVIELGGYDCLFEHANFCLHDMMFRLQYDGGRIFDSPKEITTCDHYIGKTVDHGAIYDSHMENDQPLFTKMYSDPDVLKNRVKIDINNWASQSAVWTRRFKTIPKSYEDVLKGNE